MIVSFLVLFFGAGHLGIWADEGRWNDGNKNYWKDWESSSCWDLIFQQTIASCPQVDALNCTLLIVIFLFLSLPARHRNDLETCCIFLYHMATLNGRMVVVSGQAERIPAEFETNQILWSAKWITIGHRHYSQTLHNPYLSVESRRYGLSGVMG